VTCREFHEAVGAFALGALDPAESAACEAHLAAATHDGCREAYADAMRVTGKLGASLPPVRPPRHVWTDLEGQLVATAKGERHAGQGQALRALPWGFAVAAACALFWMNGRRTELEGRLALEEQARQSAHAQAVADLEHAAAAEKTCEQDLGVARSALAGRSEAMALLELPSTKFVHLGAQKGTAAARATALVNLERRSAVLVAAGLAPQAGKDYELWVIKGTEKRPAGLLHADAHGVTTVAIEPHVLERGADALAITLEPQGGGPVPRGPIVLVGAMPKG
jgi:anti-sigma-K factor RskA